MKLAGHIAGSVNPPRLTGQIGADELKLVFRLRGHKYAIAGLAELRIPAAAFDKPWRSPARRHNIDPLVASPIVRCKITARSSFEGDRSASARHRCA